MKFRKPTKKQIQQYITVSAIVAMISFLSSMRVASGRLPIFADTLMVISLVLTCIGLFNLSRLSGDFDAITFFTTKGSRYLKQNGGEVDFERYSELEQDRRDGEANTPLWVGVTGIIVSIIITYGIIR